jgi:excisionase family DNA binding protein
MPDRLLAFAEAAELLHISKKTLKHHIAAGEISYIVIDRGTVVSIRRRPRAC